MALVPITGSVWWFVTAYVAMILIAPSYNRFLGKLNRCGIRIWMLALLVFGYTLGNLGSKLHDLERALFFYTLGVYFRDHEQCIHERKRMLFLICSALGVILNGVCQAGILTFANRSAENAVLFRNAFSMMDHLIAEPLACFGIFGLFAGLSLQSEKINRIARHTFGVYLFHEAPVFRQIIWFSLLRPWRYYGQGFLFIYIILCVMAVFIVGIVIDTIREKGFAKRLDSFADQGLERFIKTGCCQANKIKE